MDYETVLPLKTVNDIIKEQKEAAEEPQGSCGNCTCK
jgi:hypothetical protein